MGPLVGCLLIILKGKPLKFLKFLRPLKQLMALTCALDAHNPLLMGVLWKQTQPANFMLLASIVKNVNSISLVDFMSNIKENFIVKKIIRK
jgi:hypothetical protein